MKTLHSPKHSTVFADVLPSIWTYGHRNPPRFEIDAKSGTLWSLELSPRGGDEIDRLLARRTCGWPLHSMGVNYDSHPVEGWKTLRVKFDIENIEQPVVDLTPAPSP